jgi:hypothetical protein
MEKLYTKESEKNRIRKLHLQEQTSSSSSGSYETTKAWQRGGDLTNNFRGDNIVGVELTVDLPNEVDITGGKIGGFGDFNLEDDIELYDMMDEPYEEVDFMDYEEKSDVLPDSLVNLFGNLDMELDETPKKMRGSRKWRK